jgi:tetratricopeptide (TPR) repeat protein
MRVWYNGAERFVSNTKKWHWDIIGPTSGSKPSAGPVASWTMYGRLRQTQRAVEAYREAIRLNPNHADAWFNPGIEYAIPGNRAKVMEVYEQLKPLDSDAASVFFNKVVLP